MYIKELWKLQLVSTHTAGRVWTWMITVAAMSLRRNIWLTHLNSCRLLIVNDCAILDGDKAYY